MKRRSAFHNSGAPTQAYVSPTTRVFGQPSGIVPVAPSVLNSPRHLPPTTRKARYTLRKARYTLRKARYTLRKARYTLAILPSAASRQGTGIFNPHRRHRRTAAYYNSLYQQFGGVRALPPFHRFPRAAALPIQP